MRSGSQHIGLYFSGTEATSESWKELIVCSDDGMIVHEDVTTVWSAAVENHVGPASLEYCIVRGLWKLGA